MSSTAYQDCTIAYIDILGFRELVRSDQVDTILRAMRIIRRRLRKIDEVPNSPLRHTMFSDTIVLSAELTDEGIETLIHNVAFLTSELFTKGVFCRGAITSGQLYHRGATIFGPALIDAWELERQLAIFPRILVSSRLATRFLGIKNGRKANRDMHLEMAAYFRLDFDMHYHLDIFSPWMSTPSRPGLISDTVVRVVERHILRHIDPSDRIDIQRKQTKIFWLSKYLDYVEKVHGPTQVGSRKRTLKLRERRARPKVRDAGR
jgi:hypothetical protein